MTEFQTILGAVVPVFGIALVGFVIRKLDWLTEEADQSWLRVNINLLLPALILHSTLGNPALARVETLLWAAGLGFLTAAGGILLALVAAPWAGLRDLRTARTFAVATGLYNYGYVPIPLTLLLFGAETVGVLCVLMVGVELALWTVGVAVMSGTGVGRNWRRAINAPLLAIVLALVLNAIGAVTHIPGPAATLLQWLAQCAIPSALLLIGAIVADHLHDFQPYRAGRVIGMALVLRLGLLPLLFVLLARFLPLDLELKRVLVVEAAMGAAVFPIAMAKHYGGDPSTALRVVLSTSLVAFATMPLWLRFGMVFARL